MTTPTDERPRPCALACDGAWTVQRCASGCLHLRSGHLSLTFTTAEFCRFVQTLGEAYVRLSVQDLVHEQHATH